MLTSIGAIGELIRLIIVNFCTMRFAISSRRIYPVIYYERIFRVSGNLWLYHGLDPVDFHPTRCSFSSASLKFCKTLGEVWNFTLISLPICNWLKFFIFSFSSHSLTSIPPNNSPNPPVPVRLAGRLASGIRKVG